MGKDSENRKKSGYEKEWRNSTRPDASAPQSDDLGFGKRYGARARMMNKGGRLMIRRQGESVHLYHDLLEMTWTRFLMMVLIAFLTLNMVFASLYMVAGLSNLGHTVQGGFWSQFGVAFHFSAQTLTTVGYGFFNPQGGWTSVIASFEALVGLLSFALATGLVYGRFTRPTHGVLFSKEAIITPPNDQGKLSFQVSIANERSNELLEVEARMMLTMNEISSNNVVRRFSDLKLDRDFVYFLPLNWNLVHQIDEQSPLYGLNEKDFEDKHLEVLILIRAFNDDFSQYVHARSSYTFDEIRWNSRFKVPYSIDEDGTTAFKIRETGQVEPGT